MSRHLIFPNRNRWFYWLRLFNNRTRDRRTGSKKNSVEFLYIVIIRFKLIFFDRISFEIILRFLIGKVVILFFENMLDYYKFFRDYFDNLRERSMVFNWKKDDGVKINKRLTGSRSILFDSKMMAQGSEPDKRNLCNWSWRMSLPAPLFPRTCSKPVRRRATAVATLWITNERHLPGSPHALTHLPFPPTCAVSCPPCSSAPRGGWATLKNSVVSAAH